jgi:hypothetical protein
VIAHLKDITMRNDRFTTLLEERFKSKFRLKHNVELPLGTKVDLLASRVEFEWRAISFMSIHIGVKYIDAPTAGNFEVLYENIFSHAKRTNRVPLIRGLCFGYYVIPCIATTNINNNVVEYAMARPRKHWAIMEFPVLYDLSQEKAYYFRGTADWGAFIFPSLRRFVENYIEGNI